MRITLFVVIGLIIGGGSPSGALTKAPQSGGSAKTAGGAHSPTEAGQLFRKGEDALNQGRLDDAERDFRAVLSQNPNVGGAYANLGVVYMRRKQWTKALATLRTAQQLMPQVPGIRLNIGLAYFREGEYLRAIPAFESVVREQPDVLQPRHLLGLCYFFLERWTDSLDMLEPLWAQESTQLNYLYVVSIAAHRAGRTELDDRATGQLLKVGEGSAELHMLIGKGHLSLDQYDLALAELQAAALADPKLPFVHFNLGMTYLKKQDYEHARDEFLRDAAVEPDLALNYDQLGEVYSRMQQNRDAEISYHKALKRDPRLVSSYVGLAKTYQREEKYSLALPAIESAQKLDPSATQIHYIKGQVLMHLGRKDEGKKEMETSVRIDNERRAQRQKEVGDGVLPSPELTQDQ